MEVYTDMICLKCMQQVVALCGFCIAARLMLQAAIEFMSIAAMNLT